MNKVLLFVVLVLFYQAMSVPMTCIGGGVTTLGAETLNCGSAMNAGPGSWSPIGYNKYCKAGCPNGAVKLDSYSQLENTFGSYICTRNPLQPGNVQGFKKAKLFPGGVSPGGMTRPATTSTSCQCSALISALQQGGQYSTATALSNAANVACGSNALEVEQAEALESYADALEALAEEDEE
eukprot:gene8679-626_t